MFWSCSLCLGAIVFVLLIACLRWIISKYQHGKNEGIVNYISYNSETRYWFRCFHLNINSHNTKQRQVALTAVITERVTGRSPEVLKWAGEYRLQVADFFSLLFLLKTNLLFLFFLFSSLGLIMVQQTSIHVNCHGQGWHRVPSYPKMHIVGGGSANPQPWGASFTWLEAHQQT